MTSQETVNRRSPAWPWAILVAALLWAAIVRLPLVLNAPTHLDSDLAVDGLTLRDAVEGRWRWHYPGTPHMGILPVLLSWPQAMSAGATPLTLVSGGAVAYLLVIVSTFLMTRHIFGTRVAAWGLVPLAFSSTGVIWLSGRITGGHLLTVAWASAALALLGRALDLRGHGTTRLGRFVVLGFWCGLGLYLDRMFLLVLASLGVAGVLGWWWSGRPRHVVKAAIAAAVGLGAGYAPHIIGKSIDPHDAYGEQFVSIFRPFGDPQPGRPVPWEQARQLAAGHGKILVRECLPRLIAGHTLPGLDSEPPSHVPGGRRPSRKADPVALGVTAASLTLFPVALGRLAFRTRSGDDPRRRATRIGLLVLVVLVVAGFILNRNIFNSDNYRYLVLLLIPWSVGFGLLLEGWDRRGGPKRATAWCVAALLGILMSVDAHQWYEGFGWVDGLRPGRAGTEDPVVAWLEDHPEITTIYGSYWRVHRLAFLSDRPIRPIAFPGYPQRFPEWSPEQTRDGGRAMVLSGPQPFDRFEAEAMRQRGDLLASFPGTVIFDWP